MKQRILRGRYAAMAGVLLIVGSMGVVVSSASAASAASPASVTVTGAGSTWDQIATAQWISDVYAKYGLRINYQGVGSSAGRQFYIQNQVDFADSDIPFDTTPGNDEVAQLESEHKTWQYAPTVAGATGIMYNLKTPSGQRITNLRLDSRALEGIFTGTITSWRDPIIMSQNPQLASVMPNANIIPVVRADGSGTSAMFSNYLDQLQPSLWKSFCQKYQIPADECSVVSYWPLTIPGTVAQKGSDGVANYVSQQANSVCYVETGYAIERRFPVALVKNQSGNYVFPSSQNDATALTHAAIQKDLISNLTGVHFAPERNAYPISGYSYLITPTALGFGFTDAKGAVLGKFMLYMACAGQQKAAPLGYSPLTPVLVRGVFAAIRRVPGAAPPPPLNAQTCPNPTLTGQGSGGGLQGNPGGGGGGGGDGGGGGNGGGGGTTSTNGNGGTTSTTGPTDPTTVGAIGATAPPTTGVVLTVSEAEARRAATLRAVGAVHPSSKGPLVFAALDVLAFALFPWVVWRRRRSRRTITP